MLKKGDQSRTRFSGTFPKRQKKIELILDQLPLLYYIFFAINI